MHIPFCDQDRYDVRCEWGKHGIVNLFASDVIIIVDVLSFTTCVDVAVGRGAIVYPYRWKDTSAVNYARQLGAELAGDRELPMTRYSLSGIVTAD